ncbi:hypothetical protein [Salegentibacter sp. Hel_I_6]|uniref:hypothetical protein n=1 Tax=Salegentibacter sp. Hel_I_6 TaxID=1250278 RepID=UPI00055DBD3D|nr:hypothetical protein [Salegentibacter sp. Hel_I_6]
MKKFLQSILPFFLIIAVFTNANSQNTEENLVEKIADYKLLNKELAYLHLNKSHFLKGEQLGFAAYVLNESTHKPEVSNSNLYVTVKNDQDSIIREEMYLIEDGITSGVIDIDSSFIAGNYTISAFTGSMKNFEEPYHFSEKFKVLSSSSKEKISRDFPDKIDVQFLPESGHFLDNTINNVGVIATDSLGKGLANGKIIIKDENAQLVSIIDLNKFGIGKFSFIPKKTKSYSAVFVYMDNEVPVAFSPEIDYEGLILSVSEKESELEVLIKTNERSLSNYESEKLFLVAQDSENFYSFDIAFKDFTNASVVFNLNELEPGMNIFTLFNEKMQPIAERLYFNHENFKIETPENISTNSKKDSLEINIPFVAEKEGKVSISILPENTIAHQRNHNIISYNHLKPYVKGNIENAAWYFTNITPEKKLALDNLLLTQGWSSYNWGEILNENIQSETAGDRFSFKAEISPKDRNKKDLRYMVHGVGANIPQVIEIDEGTTSFVLEEYFPIQGEKLKISRIKPNDNLVPANLKIYFMPNKFPDFDISQIPLAPGIYTSSNEQTQNFYNYEGLNTDAELLDEVQLSTNVERPIDRARQLGYRSFGRVLVVSEKDLNIFNYLADLLRNENLIVIDKPEFSVKTYLSEITNFNSLERDDDRRENKIGEDRAMTLYLDDSPMLNTSIFYNFPLTQVDYIEINKTGMGEGMMGANGTIKVYTKPGSHLNSISFDRIQSFDIPLAYTEQKEYYVPKYENTSDEFFQEFGVIDWIPEVSFEKGKAAVIKIKKPEVDFQLIIEGVTSDGDLIQNIQQLSADSI